MSPPGGAGRRPAPARPAAGSGAFSIHLDQVFVEVRIAPNSAQQVSLSALGGKELSGNRTIWDFLSRTAQGEGEALAILGPPGAARRRSSSMSQNSCWHETLRLYAAQGDASALIQGSLALDTVPALALASECLQEARNTGRTGECSGP